MQDENRYILTHEEMLKISEFTGNSIWRLRRAILIETAGPMFVIFLWAMMYLADFYLRGIPSRVMVIAYWGFLAVSSAGYVLFRIRWGQNKREMWLKKAREEMLLGMEEAKVKHEIETLTDDISHG